MSLNKDKIREEGLKLIEEFSEMLEDVPETEETHYVIDLRNVARDDGKPRKRKDFQKKMEKNAPRWENNYIIAEKGR